MTDREEIEQDFEDVVELILTRHTPNTKESVKVATKQEGTSMSAQDSYNNANAELKAAIASTTQEDSNNRLRQEVLL